MKIITNKNIGKKIIIAILIVLVFQFILLKPVHADNVEFGGKLISPVLSLLVTLSDGIMDIIGNAIMGASSSLYPIEMANGALEKILTAAIFLITAAAIIGALVITGMGVAALASAILGKTIMATVGIGTIIAGIGGGIFAGVYFNDERLPDDLYLPMYTYSAEEIFKGNILLFDVNFFNSNEKEIKAMLSDGTELSLKDHTPQEIQNIANGKKIKKKVEGTTSKAEDAAGREAEVSAKVEYYFYEENGEKIKTSSQNSATMLKKTISTWYNALRNICIVLMLSVLVYIGIRILLSSVASDKAKYMTMLRDWLVGLCLLFLMHYIMAFSVSLVERLTTVVKTSVGQNGYSVTMEANDKMEKAVDAEHLNQPDLIQKSDDGKKYLVWPTNLMGSLRLRLQMEDYGAEYIGLCICFIILCLFTLYFTVTYLKRVLHMAFLTLIAPMVALTYCIDKLNDGQAQGFNKWFKEYIFNLLIQPMHLLLYYILVTSAFEFASMNVIYSIVALGFMIPAEKLLRSLFGFEKAQTAPAMGPAGAMMASTALNHLLNRGKGGKGGKDGGKGGSGSSGDEGDSVPNPREASNPMSSYLDVGEDDSTQPPEGDLPDMGPELPDPSAEIDPLEGENGNDGDNGDYKYSNEDYEEMVRDTLGPDATEEDVQNALRDWYGIGEPEDNEGAEGVEQEELEEAEEEETPSLGQRFRNKMNSTSFGRQAMRNIDANWAAQKASIRMAKSNAKDAIANSHPLKTAGKMAAGAALGTAAGAMGVAIAASTGEDGNLAKIGGAAAATGYAVGAGKAKNIKSASDDPTVQAIYDNTYNKGQYKQDAMNEYVEKYKKNEKYRNYLETKFDAKTAKEMIEGGEIEEYLYNGINDIKDMAVMHKMQKDKVVKNRQEAISVAQLNQMVGSDTTKMTGKKREEWQGRFKEMAGQAGVAENNRDAFAKQRLTELDAFNNYKK